jgi:hypothetical protein
MQVSSPAYPEQTSSEPGGAHGARLVVLKKQIVINKKTKDKLSLKLCTHRSLTRAFMFVKFRSTENIWHQPKMQENSWRWIIPWVGATSVPRVCNRAWDVDVDGTRSKDARQSA